MRLLLLLAVVTAGIAGCSRMSGRDASEVVRTEDSTDAPAGDPAADWQAAACRAWTPEASLPRGGTLELLTPARVGLGAPVDAQLTWREDASLDGRCARPRSALHLRVEDGPWLDLDVADDYAPTFCGVGQWSESRSRRVGGFIPDRAMRYPEDRDQRAFAFAAAVLPRLRVGDNQMTLRVAHGCLESGELEFQNAATTRFTITVDSAEQLAAYRELVGPRVRRGRGRSADRARGFFEGTQLHENALGGVVAVIPIDTDWYASRGRRTRSDEHRRGHIGDVAVVTHKCDQCFVEQLSVMYGGGGLVYLQGELQWRASPRIGQPFPCPGSRGAAGDEH